MKNDDNKQTEVDNSIHEKSVLTPSENDLSAKAKHHLKTIIFLTCLTGIALFFNACTAAYVATEPSYVEYSRPQQPSTFHIWIDGDWVYNRTTHTYVQHNGYWEKPSQQRSYVSGHWQTTPRGKYWSKGHWQKKGGKGNRNSR